MLTNQKSRNSWCQIIRRTSDIENWYWLASRALDLSGLPIFYDLIKRKWSVPTRITRFFYRRRFFSTHSHCCLTFSWTKLQMLLRCCLIHVSIIKLRHFFYLRYLCPCLDLGLLMSGSIFHYRLHFIMINTMNTDTLVLLLIF